MANTEHIECGGCAPPVLVESVGRKVYVVCIDFHYEGYGPPLEVFTSLEALMAKHPDARDLCNEKEGKTCYFELELQEG